ncbi:ADOP family duplicated permease [Roseisolibacter agri]|uniref:Macrolide export ATP-binding/permease protein MacB n=1 Tax=Roseisolibacter agri TaxID=2014610 RepID=A0AA37VCW3_9BACT|nr:ADOP family duplicated permease [Roseisolibacter agri]GLC28168.1 hypothetical protein rosag_46810 [Roseisolibacter agri]
MSRIPGLRRVFQFPHRTARIVAADVDEELAFHLDLRAAELMAERGLNAEAARAEALRQFGDLEEARRYLRALDARTESAARRRDMLETLVRDLRFAFRGLRRAPLLAITAVAILALGLATAAAMLSVSDAVLRRPLPVADAGRLVVLWNLRGDNIEHGLLPQQVAPFARDSRTLRAVAGYAHFGVYPFPLYDGGRPLVLPQGRVTGNFFDVLGARPALGRLLRPEDDVPGAPGVLVLSHDTWRRAFAGDPRVVGRRLHLASVGRDFTVVGVAPPGLDFPVGAAYWAPLATAGPSTADLVGRLAPGRTPREAAAELYAWSGPRAPEAHLTGAHAAPFGDAVVGASRPTLVVLTAAAGLLLLIAAVNVSTLLVLRTTARARELAVRRALGARPWDVARPLAAECLLLVLAGGTLGVLGGAVLLRAFVATASARVPVVPRADLIGLAPGPVLLALGLTLGAVLLAGVLPVRSLVRAPVAPTLRLDARAGRGTRGRARTRQGLVAAQAALALVLLAGAGLLVRSLAKLERVDHGYAPGGLLIAQITMSQADYTTAPAFRGVLARAYARLRAVPGVTSVTPVLIPPFLGATVWSWPTVVRGPDGGTGGAVQSFPVEAGGAEYFRTMGVPIRRGRGITDADGEHATPVVVVSEAAARRLFPGRDPIGQQLRFPTADSTAWWTVVGVAGDIRYRSLREATPTLYLSYQQVGDQGEIALRTTGDPARLVPALRRALAEVDPRLGLWDARPMGDYLAGPLAVPRLATALAAGFGLVAAVLVGLGLYGVTAAAVGERTREFGVRSALGATPGALRSTVLRQALAVAGAGAVVGLAGAWGASRLVRAVLYDVSPADPAALTGAVALLVVVALAAAYGPARRATRVDPAGALRAE